MTSEKSDRAGLVAPAVRHRSALLREFVRERRADPRAPLVVGKDCHSPVLAFGHQAARDDARLVLRKQRELIEVLRARARVGEEIQGEHRHASGGERRDGRNVLLGERADDEARAVLDRVLVGAGHRFRRDVVDLQARPGARVLVEVSRDEAVAHRRAHGLGAAGQGQQQGDLVGELARHRDLGLRRRQHDSGWPGVADTAPASCRVRPPHARDRAAVRPRPCPAAAIPRRWGRTAWAAFSGEPRWAAVRILANNSSRLARSGRPAQVALALDEGARALHGRPAQKERLAAQVPVVLREVGRRRHADRIQLAQCAARRPTRPPRSPRPRGQRKWAAWRAPRWTPRPAPAWHPPPVPRRPTVPRSAARSRPARPDLRRRAARRAAPRRHGCPRRLGLWRAPAGPPAPPRASPGCRRTQ